MDEGKILFLACCSNTKAAGGGSYSPEAGLAGRLPGPLRGDLHRWRRRAREIMATGLGRQGRSLSEHPMNQGLQPGPDFGESLEGGAYLRACERYEGRFYQGLGPAGKRKELFVNGPHAFLILSGLYGLVDPLECIQRYSLHLLDSPSLTELWRQDRLLDRVLAAEIRRADVRLVLDFLALRSYRSVIDWAWIGFETGARVLHACGEANAGEAALPSFGQLVGKLLKDKPEKLLRVGPGHRFGDMAWETVVLHDGPEPPPGLPVELSPPPADPVILIEDRWIRTLRVMDQAERRRGLPEIQEPKAKEKERIGRLRDREIVPPSLAEALHELRRMRNEKVKGGKSISAEELARVEALWPVIQEWAVSQDYEILL
jgi:hypothetical protein